MVLRNIKLTNQTAAIQLLPPGGYRWRFHTIAIFLITGSGVGNRRVYAVLTPIAWTDGYGPGLADTLVQTGESSTYVAA